MSPNFVQLVSSLINSSNKNIGLLIGARAGDVIWYFKTDDNKKGRCVSINPQEIGICKYKEMLIALVKSITSKSRKIGIPAISH